MSDERQELWIDKVRSFAKPIQEAEYDVFEAEANIKRIKARLMLEATASGCRTVASQETFAEDSPRLYEARIALAKSKGLLSGLKVQLDAIKVGFEEWRTKMVNAREEQKRYGA
tara:strand:- start:61 stop:402 length:342 start_codon:yes stop_codon:yes gene_type:complete